MKKLFATAALMLSTLSMSASDYYLSTSGSDANDGLSREKAFATLGKAQSVVKAGDNVYILPGTYVITEDQISKTEDVYKIVFNMNLQGAAGKPIRFIGLTEDGNRPMFDMSAVNPTGYRVTAFLVSGQYLVFRNFEITGIQVNITDHTQSENIRVTNGTYCTFDNISCHDGMGIGFYLTKRSHHNLFLNCDAYNNYDSVSESGKGGQSDGFGCHVLEGQENNIFIGCRAWNNSDDGYDLINCYSPVTFCYSIAYKNGFDASGTSRQDGNGFKAGGFGMGGTVTLPESGAPRHQVYHCLAVQNKSNGFYSNHHLGGINVSYNTAVNQNKFSYSNNFSLVNRKDGSYPDGAVDVNGYSHQVHHNLSVYTSGNEKHVASLDGTDTEQYWDNSFTWDAEKTAWVNSYTAEFTSTNTDRLVRSRKSDGMLDPSSTLTVYQQTTYTGMGCDFSGYEAAIETAKQQAGAGEEEGGEVKNTYIGVTRTWDFSDMSEGTVVAYTNYHGLVLRGTAGSHAITTKSGQVSFAANGANIRDSYLAKDKQAADDLDNTTYDRCLAFNTSVAGKTTVTFSASSNNADRRFLILFKAAGKTVVVAETEATKAQTTLSLTSTEAGSFFICGTIACNVHEVTFQTGATGIGNVIISPSSLGEGNIYDLHGRRVTQPVRGIYICNGKKVFIK